MHHVIATSMREIFAAAVFGHDGDDQLVGFSARETRMLHRQESLPLVEVLLDLPDVLEHGPANHNLQGMRRRVHYPEVVVAYIEAYRVVQSAYMFVDHGLDAALVTP